METVTFGTAIVKIYARSDGKWSVKWREGRRGRSTTKTRKEDAVILAKATAKRLDGASGRQFVTAGEAELLQALKVAAGATSPFGWLEKVREAIGEAGGVQELREAARDYAEAKRKRQGSRTFSELYDRLEAEYSKHQRNETWKTMRTELQRFRSELGDLAIEAISPEQVEEWCGRGTPAARTYNNRRAIWSAALGRAREVQWIDPNSRTAAEIAPKRREPQKSPEIWTPDQGREILRLLRERSPDLVAYFALQCWAGLRPTEAQELEWKDINDPEGYLRVRHEVAGKLSAERFVPIQPNLAEILETLPPAEGRIPPNRGATLRKRDLKRMEKFPAPLNAAKRLSSIICGAEIVKAWPHDVCRHSFCTYRLAATKAIGTVAEEAGNSEAVIRKSYRRPMTKEAGDEWFLIC